MPTHLKQAWARADLSAQSVLASLETGRKGPRTVTIQLSPSQSSSNGCRRDDNIQVRISALCEQHRYLNMNDLRETKKEALRRVA